MRTFDPGKIQVIIGGFEISGFADGTFVEAGRDEDAFTKVVGAKGEVSRSKSNNKSGFIKIILQQTSPSNDTLSAIAIADEQTNAGVVPVIVKDALGTSLIFSAEGWVKKMPDYGAGKEIGNREWMIDAAVLEYFVGGND